MRTNKTNNRYLVFITWKIENAHSVIALCQMIQLLAYVKTACDTLIVV